MATEGRVREAVPDENTMVWCTWLIILIDIGGGGGHIDSKGKWSFFSHTFLPLCNARLL